MKKFFLISILLLLWAAPALGAMSADEIVHRANLASYYGGDDGKARVTMTITDSQGRERKREFIILRRDVADGGDQNFYVYFRRPSDVRKMVFMVKKHVKGDDDRWLYLSKLDLVKRIAASDKRTSFVGSNFFYEDVSGRSEKEDSHKLLEETADHYVIENIPKNPDAVEFASYKVWIRKKDFMPDKAEYTDKQGRLYRVVEALEIKEIQGIPTVTKSRVRDLNSKSQTVSEFSKIQYNIGIKDSVFTERYLRRPPREARR